MTSWFRPVKGRGSRGTTGRSPLSSSGMRTRRSCQEFNFGSAGVKDSRGAAGLISVAAREACYAIHLMGGPIEAEQCLVP